MMPSLVEIARYLQLKGRPLEGELLERTRELLAEAPIVPRSVWAVEGDAIYLAGTIGGEFDCWQRKVALFGATDALIAQAIGAAAVEQVMDVVEAEAKAAVPGDWGPRRSPGYGNMALSESAKILAKLNSVRNIGIVCTPEYSLLPTKSVTAILRLFDFCGRGKKKGI